MALDKTTCNPSDGAASPPIFVVPNENRACRSLSSVEQLLPRHHDCDHVEHGGSNSPHAFEKGHMRVFSCLANALPPIVLRFLPISAPLIVLGISIGASIALYLAISSVQWSHLQLSAEGFCSIQSDRFQGKLASSVLHPLHAVNSFLAQLPNVNQDAITRFCDLAHWSRHVRLSVVQKVKGQDRPAWETRSNITIRWIQPVYSDNGTFISIGTPKLKPYNSEPVYYPSVFVYPANTNALRGLDPNHSARRLAFSKATALAPPPFASDTTSLPGFLSDPFRMLAGNGATKDTPHPYGIAYILPPLLPRENGDVNLVTGGYNLYDFMRSSIASPATEKSGMRIILTINRTRVYETVAFDDMGADSPNRAVERFTMAGQSFELQCIPTESRQAFYVNQWRFVSPSLLLAIGVIASAALSRFLRQAISIRETTADVEKWMDNSRTILQAAANPMLIIDNNGRISGLNAPFLKLTGQSTNSLRDSLSVTNLLKQPPSTSDALDGAPLLKPGKREVQVHHATKPGAAIDVIMSVSNPVLDNPAVHQVLVLTDLSEKKARDAVLEQLLHLIRLLNSQQQQVLSYVVAQLPSLISAMSTAANHRIVAAADEMHAIQLALQHLVDMHEELSNLTTACPVTTQSFTVNWIQLQADLSPILQVVPTSQIIVESPFVVSIASLSALVKFCRIVASIGVEEIQVGLCLVSTFVASGSGQHLMVSARLPESTSKETMSVIAEDRDWAALGCGDSFNLLGLRMVALRKQLLLQCGGSIDLSGSFVSFKVPAHVGCV